MAEFAFCISSVSEKFCNVTVNGVRGDSFQDTVAQRVQNLDEVGGIIQDSIGGPSMNEGSASTQDMGEESVQNMEQGDEVQGMDEDGANPRSMEDAEFQIMDGSVEFRSMDDGSEEVPHAM